MTALTTANKNPATAAGSRPGLVSSPRKTTPMIAGGSV
jgi:hypothetical protein